MHEVFDAHMTLLRYRMVGRKACFFFARSRSAISSTLQLKHDGLLISSASIRANAARAKLHAEARASHARHTAEEAFPTHSANDIWRRTMHAGAVTHHNTMRWSKTRAYARKHNDALYQPRGLGMAHTSSTVLDAAMGHSS